MLLQITIVPPPNILGPLVALGQGLGQILNPQGQQRQAFLNLLASNPEILTQFRIAQEQAEEQAMAPEFRPTQAEAQAAADITAPAPTGAERFRPNVLAAFGFELEEAERILRASPETIKQAKDAELRRLAVPELQARIEFDKARAEGIVTRGILTEGIPQLRLNVILQEATTADAIAVMRTKEFLLYENILERMLIEEPALRNLLTLSEFAPDFAKLITDISIADAQAAVGAAKDGIDLANATFTLANSWDKAITEKIQQCRDAEGDKQALRLCIQQVNEMSRRRIADLPNTTHTALAVEQERWLFRHKIQLRVFGPSDLLAGIQDAFVPRVSKGLTVDDAIAEMIVNDTTRARWIALSPEEQEIWKVQLETKALIQDAEEVGEPITAAEEERLVEELELLLVGPSAPFANFIIAVIKSQDLRIQGVRFIVRVVERALGLTLEGITSSVELIKFIRSEEGKAAIKRIEGKRLEPQLLLPVEGDPTVTTPPPPPIPFGPTGGR